MNNREEIWVKKGYELFAIHGEIGLNIEQLSKQVGISKSSFYHHFADLEGFVEKLMQYHLQQSKIIAEKERMAQSIDPELIQILLEHQTDILFNRQLRINAHQSSYSHTLMISNQLIGKDFILLWLKDSKLPLTFKQAEGIFDLALENFFLQINPENFTAEWLESYFENLKRISASFTSPLDGSD
ncbi:TetR/AcrR family transcriptional regulator [Algoriphagus marincola]|uniref:TetR/AcrR family transcriptional regulator n=1 Tax=Algoriphagus marincola TaxID=264027 RepID=A0ABS7N6L9_9BACT|nr:TetR/AcrR family transcriptional regulator [Algoriphagus marincola]MBY5951625.1 TetR/AcrR family transcriptional regulator [Algoriphagus marincola]